MATSFPPAVIAIVIVIMVWLLGGCHLIFPFDVTNGQEAGTDGSAADTPRSSETGPASDAGSDKPAADIPVSETGTPDAAADTASDPHWHKALGGLQNDYGISVAVDSYGNVCIAGFFTGTADLGGGNVTSKGGYDIFVTSFTGAGVHRWQKALGGTSDDFGQGVAVDGSDNVYLTGTFKGTSDLGGGSVTSVGSSSDIFVTSFTGSGAHRWQKALGGTAGDYGEGVAVDGSGNVYLTGHFTGTADLGGGNVTSANPTAFDIFVTSFTSGGVHRWQKALGGTSIDQGRSVAVDSSGNVYLTGYFEGTADLGNGDVTSKGGDDIFLLKLGP